MSNQSPKKVNDEQEQGATSTGVTSLSFSIGIQEREDNQTKTKKGTYANSPTKLKRPPKLSINPRHASAHHNLLPPLSPQMQNTLQVQALGQNEEEKEEVTAKTDIPNGTLASPVGSHFGSPLAQVNLDKERASGLNTSTTKYNLSFTQSMLGLPKLITGDDAIEYFAASQGKNLPMKFVYLKRRDQVLREAGMRVVEYHPYDLVVVQPENLGNDYFIMTSSAILHFAPESKSRAGGGKASKTPTEVVDMAQWVHESSIFRLLRNLKTFSLHIKCKAVHKWRSAVRYIRFCSTRRAIAKKLFLLKKHLQPTLLQALKQLHRCTTKPALLLEARKACNLSDFIGKQVTHLEGTVLSDLNSVGISIGQAAVSSNSAIRQEMQELNKQLIANEEGSENKSMAAVRKRREAVQAAIRQMRDDFQRFPIFCRFINYLIMGELMQYTVETCGNLLEFLDNPVSIHTGVFRVTIDMMESGSEQQVAAIPDDEKEPFELEGNNRLVFMPSFRAMRSSFHDLKEKLYHTLDTIPLVPIVYVGFKNTKEAVDSQESEEVGSPTGVQSKEANGVDNRHKTKRLATTVEQNTSIAQICRTHEPLESMFFEIKRKVTRAYKEATVFGTKFEVTYRDLYDHVHRFDPIAYRESKPTFEKISEDLRSYRKWDNQLGNMKQEKRCTTLVVIETRSFRDLMQRGMSSPFETFKDLLTGFGRVRAQDLVTEYRRACAQMVVEETATLNQHAQYVESTNSFIERRARLEEKYEQVQSIYELLEEMKVKCSIEDLTQLQDVGEQRDNFHQAIDTANTHIDAQKQNFVSKLEEAIQAAEQYCDDITIKLGREPYTDPANDPVEICKQLKKYRSRWKNQLSKAKQFANMRYLFLGSTYDYDMGPIENARAMLDKRQQVWETFKNWNQSYEIWWNSDVESFLRETEEAEEDGAEAVGEGSDGPASGTTNTEGEGSNKEADEGKEDKAEENENENDTSFELDIAKTTTNLDGPKLEKIVDEYFQSCVVFNRKWKGDAVVETLMQLIRDCRSRITFAVQFGHPSLYRRHYVQMFSEVFQEDLDPEATVTLSQMESLGLFKEDNVEPLEEICGTAAKEYSLLKALDNMELEWEPMKFDTVDYKDTGTSILRSMDEIEQILDDQIVRTQAMRASRYIKQFEKRCADWETRIKSLEEIISNWLSMQSTWLYLEPIFSSPDICKQMPAEAKNFKIVDALWRSSMKGVNDNPSVMAVFEQEGLLEQLQKANVMLDMIQKGLADYLNQKRVFFPRFFFLSNDELLEILSETKDPKRVQPHLIKCFEGINELEFTDSLDILSMISAEGEKVPFRYEDVKEKIINPNDAGGCVEIWLDQIQTVMRKTVAQIFDESIVAYKTKSRTEWLCDWPGQIVLGVTQTYWTQECTAAIREGVAGTQAYADVLTEYINDIIKMVRGNISKIVRKTVSPLVVLDVHSRDVTQELCRLGIDDPNDFDWLCQLRYYWTEGRASAMSGDPGTVECRMINAVRQYGYEYLGNSMRLVITPLTDRCYRTLMGAIHLDYGGAPAGPAGTGKTETTKDLGKAVAIQCVVYNCSDSLDYKAMGKFFKGLAGTGAWACFDEFNRIDLEVLSVVAQQILTIQRAKVAVLETFEFEGEIIKLRVTCNVFITMNPGYAGRQELPDNLKALFRGVAMMVPDYGMIGQIILYSMGYLEGFKLAKKIVMTYKLCSEQLSNQSHYDYGMRAVMAVLRAAGNLKRQQPDEDENILCLRSIIDVNLPKFLAPDVPLFNGIVSDLFPGVKLPEVDYTEMTKAIRAACKRRRLEPTPYFLGKVYEVYEMMIVRHGFMVVGRPFAGKTSALSILAESLTALREQEVAAHGDSAEDAQWTRVHNAILNPKSITMGQLYGEFDPVSHEWTDGVLAIAYRRFASNPPKIGRTEDRKWVTFDGPVDAIWIENMNTVLDDNKKLCLMSGEMIMMSPTMSMIFEPMDLEVASPATVSRVGVIYMEPERMGWQPCLYSWLMKYTKEESSDSVPAEGEQDQPNGAGEAEAPASGQSSDEEFSWFLKDDEQELLQKLFQWLVDPMICFVRKSCVEQVPTLDQTLVVGLLRYLECLLDNLAKHQWSENGEKRVGEAGVALDNEVIENCFLFALIWSIGGTVDAAGRLLFNTFLQEFITDAEVVNKPELKGVNTLLLLREWSNPFKGTYMFSKPIPCFVGEDSEENCYDFCYEPATKEWVKWMETVPESASSIDKGEEFSRIVVPTVVTAQLDRFLEMLLTHDFPPLVLGPTGTGKSMFIQQVLSNTLSQDIYKAIFIAFTAKTSANQTQDQVDLKLDKRKRGVFGPALGCKALVFVDDMNMPEVEEYGAQPPIEILRQLIDNGGWYDLKSKEFQTIIDTNILGAMGPPGGGRNHITPRFLRHFTIFGVSSFDDETMLLIFRNIFNWHMGNQQMPAEVEHLTEPIITATLKAYRSAMDHLLPTPMKSHYTFNLRDFARIVQGILLVKKYPGINADVMKRLWVHESLRVISDRLIDAEDQTWFANELKSLLESEFETDADQLMASTMSEGQEPKFGMDSLRNLFFGDYSNPDEPVKKYLEIEDVPGLVPLMEDYLDVYNSESKSPMYLVMFMFAIEHVSRIARVLSMPRGNMLLVGVGGSGRQSLTRLAAHVADYNLKQIELSKNYTEVEWREDLRNTVKEAGTGAKPMVFLFCDTQVKYPSFIEDINSVLNTGEVPALFPVDVKMDILDRMQKIAKEIAMETGVRKDYSQNDLWAMFIDRVRSNMHIVLAFSPIGSAFRDRLRKFPSLVNCCTIDWFFAWPQDALVAVASKFLKEVELESKVREEIVNTCQYMHDSVRNLSLQMKEDLKRINYVTPTSYLELIRSFKDSLALCREEVNSKRRRYEIGLEKLAFASEQVETMQVELTSLLPVLETSKKETDALMKIIEEKLPGVQKMSEAVGEEAKVVQAQADACNEMKEECESDLAEAVPLLEDAMKALNTLKPSDITEVKAMKTPPSGVVLVMSAVCQMMGVKPDKVQDPNNPTKKVEDYWGPSKKHLLGDPKFLQSLQSYDKDNIPDKVIKVLQAKYVNNPDFEPAKIKQASLAAFGLCKWVRAMEAYDRVAKVVAPKKAKLKETEAELSATMDKLNAKKAELKKVEDDLGALQDQLKEAKDKKNKLESDVDLCEKKLVRAKQLIDGLGGERDRWTSNVEQLKLAFIDLTGDVLASSGSIAYLGSFTQDYRQEVTDSWIQLCKDKKVPCSSEPSLFNTLGDPVKIRAWNVNGLPTDSFSVDNAIILFNSRRWPLLIDPQGQANRWVRNMEKENGLKVVKLSDGNYMRTVENAVQFGSPILLENVGEELDPTLEPLLQRATFKQGGVLCIRLGDNVVEYSEQFRFYITTKLTNPHYLPEVSVKVTLLNFMITPAGLEDQMLAKVVKEEKPELAAEKERLIVEGAANAAKLKECEDKILHILSSSSGNILEDESAIDALKSSKEISTDITAKQAVAVETEQKIDTVRSKYVPVAYRAQLLYFCIADMANIEPTYQYALEWFGELFVKAVGESPASDDLETRLQNLNDYFTYYLYCNICRSLLEKDKLLFSFLLTTRIMMGDGLIDGDEWYFFLTGGVVSDTDAPNPAPEWLSDKGWGELVRLSALPSFNGLSDDVAASPSEFKVIYDSSDAHLVPVPCGWDEKLNEFQHMLVTRALRPDKIILAVQNFVISHMGEQFVKPPTFNLKACYDDSSFIIPLVFVLSAGSDPMTALIKLSEDTGSRIDSISLGQGQGPKAERMIERAQGYDGEKVWVVLQNCHLATSWMPSLEKIVEDTDPQKCNKNYRLWCTTYPTKDFPVSILQNSVKMTLEPPKGLRQNILGSYKSDPICDPGFFNSVARNDGKEWRVMLYGLCFFHALVQERREFGSLGWNNPYEYNNSDLNISVKQLAMFLDLYPDLPFKALNYCTGECNYGGRVTDDKDRRCLMTILMTFFNEDVLKEGYKYSESGVYIAPPDGSYENYLEFIESLPLVVHPEVFGFHENANITKDQNETLSLFKSILLTQKGGGGGGSKAKKEDEESGENEEKEAQAVPQTSEDIIFNVAQSILAKMPQLFDMELAELKYPVRWDQSMNTVLVQELLRFNVLNKVVVASLKDVMKAVKGIIVMSDELEKVGQALLYGLVPGMWLNASYPSLKPLAGYVSDLLERLEFMQRWLDNSYPPSYWVSGFYFTQAFLTGTLQNFARKYTVPIDEVDFDFEVQDQPVDAFQEAPEDGAYIYGLFIDGARWDPDTMAIAQSQPKVLISPAPVIQLVPQEKKNLKQFLHYSAPVYKTSERRGILSTTGHSTNFVMWIRLPSLVVEDVWIKAGVAMLTQLDE